MKATVVIVDGYSGGVHLAPHFKAQGLDLIHVQSDAKIWSLVLPLFDFSPYKHCFSLAQSSLKTLLEQLQAYNIMAVIPGTETGVELADSLAQALNVPGNGIGLSHARRDKYQMLKACAQAGVPVGKFFKSSNAKELLAWYRSELSPRMVVLKPLCSAGTDGVRFCSNEAELAQAFEALIGTENKLGFNNQEMLACEFLAGTEYFLNSVSLNGKHSFTDIWRYEKRSINGHRAVYDRNILCEHDGMVEQQLRAYAKKVLVALNIQWGPAHIEIMMTEQGPKLVEIGARLDGLTLPEVNRAAVGFSPVDRTFDCFMHADMAKHSWERGYELQQQAQTVYLTSYRSGHLTAFPGEEKLKKLRCFFQLSMRVKNGAKVAKTQDYFTAPGFVTLIGANPEDLEHDYQQIRQWEAQDVLFEIQPQ